MLRPEAEGGAGVDAARRRLERRVAAGDVDATLALARAHERAGEDALAYLLHWKVDGPEAERAALGRRLAARQADVLREVAGRPPLVACVAVEAKARGRGLEACDWRWITAEQALAEGARPVLAARLEWACESRHVTALARLDTLAALEVACPMPLGALLDALGRARALGALRLGTGPVTPEDLARLAAAAPSLVALHLGRPPAPLEPAHLRALAGLRGLVTLDLSDAGEVPPAALVELAAALPRLDWLDASAELWGAKLARVVAGLPAGVGVGVARWRLVNLLGHRLADEARALLAQAHGHDPEARRLARAVSREVAAASDAAGAWRALAPLVRRELADTGARAVSVAAVGALAVVSDERTDLLPPLVAALESARDGPHAAKALRRCALRGGDLAPHVPALEAVRDDPAADGALRDAARDLLHVARARARGGALADAVLGHVGGRTDAWSPTAAQGPVERLLAWAAGEDDPEARAAAEVAAPAGARPRSPEQHAALAALLRRALEAGDAWVTGQALAGLPPLLRLGLRADAALLACLGRRAACAGADAAGAGAALWAAARCGHDMAPAIACLAERAGEEEEGEGAALAWGRRGASPALARRLAERGVVEVLPAGVTHARTKAPDDTERYPSWSGVECGGCGGKDTVCIHHDAFGSNAGGWEGGELLCRACGLYTFTERDWG